MFGMRWFKPCMRCSLSILLFLHADHRPSMHTGACLTLRCPRAQANAGHARHTKLTYSRAKPSCAFPRPGSAAAAALSAMESAGGGMERRLLCREDLRRAAQLREQPVELYWPQDDTWWPARITDVRPPCFPALPMPRS